VAAGWHSHMPREAHGADACWPAGGAPCGGCPRRARCAARRAGRPCPWTGRTLGRSPRRGRPGAARRLHQVGPGRGLLCAAPSQLGLAKHHRISDPFNEQRAWTVLSKTCGAPSACNPFPLLSQGQLANTTSSSCSPPYTTDQHVHAGAYTRRLQTGACRTLPPYARHGALHRSGCAS